MMSGNSHTDKNGDVADVSVLPVQQGMAADDVGEMEETSPEATRQQKLIKAGLLVVLAAIVVYVVLDYTVSAHSRHLLAASAYCCCTRCIISLFDLQGVWVAGVCIIRCACRTQDDMAYSSRHFVVAVRVRQYLIAMYYLCVGLCDHRACISLGWRNQHGHWVCWMSTSRRTLDG